LTDYYALSGSAEDIQDAIDLASTGDNVYIPEGTFSFVEVLGPWITTNIPAGVNLFGAPTEKDENGQVIEWKTILRMPFDDTDGETWFSVNGSGVEAEATRISDIKLIGYRSIDNESITNHTAVSLDAVLDFRIDHCYFEHTTLGIKSSSSYGNTQKFRGLIDHCYLVNEYGTPTPYESLTIGYGVQCAIDDHTIIWEDIDDVLGHYNNYTVFIEDCYFKKWRHCFCINTGGHIVFRHNIIENDFGFGSLDIHEQRVSTSGRATEIYENKLLDPLEGWGKIAIKWRGGGGVAFNNKVVDYELFAYLTDSGNDPPYRPQDIWIWNNDLPDGVDAVSMDPPGEFTEGIEYFLYEKPDYEPYPYPHPLRGEENGGEQPKTEKPTRADLGSQKFYDGMGKEITSQVIDLYILEKDNAELEDFKRYYNGMGKDISVPVMRQAKKIRNKS